MAEQAIERMGPKEAIVRFLEENRAAIESVAPETGRVGFDRLMTLFRQAMFATPRIALCTRASIIDSFSRCMRWDLDPAKPNTCYFVPSNEKVKDINGNDAKDEFGKPIYELVCRLRLGYMGMCELVMRDGAVEFFDVETVHEGDDFSVERGTSPFIKHVPNYREKRTGNGWCFYAVAHYKTKAHKSAVMTKPEVDEIRAMSQMGRYGPWADRYNEQAKKTVLRRLCKTLVLSPEAADMIGDDDAAEFPQFREDTRAASIAADVRAERGLPEPEPSVEIEQPTSKPEVVKASVGDKIDPDEIPF